MADVERLAALLDNRQLPDANRLILTMGELRALRVTLTQPDPMTVTHVCPACNRPTHTAQPQPDADYSARLGIHIQMQLNGACQPGENHIDNPEAQCHKVLAIARAALRSTPAAPKEDDRE